MVPSWTIRGKYYAEFNQGAVQLVVVGDLLERLESEIALELPLFNMTLQRSCYHAIKHIREQ